MRDQSVGRQAHQRETQVEAYCILGHDQAQITSHRQQEENTKPRRLVVACQAPGCIQACHQPKQAAEEQEHAAAIIQSELYAEQQPGQRNAAADRYDGGREQRWQWRNNRSPAGITLACKDRQRQGQHPDQ